MSSDARSRFPFETMLNITIDFICLQAERAFRDRNFIDSAYYQQLLDENGIEFLVRGDKVGWSRFDEREIHEVELPLVAIQEVLASTPQPVTVEPQLTDEEIAYQLAEERQKARVEKDWQKADELRGQIKALGYRVIDLPDGWRLIPDK